MRVLMIAVAMCCLCNVALAKKEEAAAAKAAAMKATFTIIDKLTASTHHVSGSVGSTIAHGKIDIHIKKCWIEKAATLPEHAALVEIYDSASHSAPSRLFSGWLFAQKSEISNLEHSSYDVTLKACEVSG